ncbi:hypothetical protein BC936DRAFT_141659 [Jimgerdemannia flammicorona]|uniref:Zn(2)-C6 fungal-type domain-containing protein n=1 Tax=Jimgerdemannia flammicorona TaxID=994334 RepID=A0A433DFW8_9FUNG|nr:hypothetical protein BC936DRAFT_141659 [Jimgerdemannia flammicorona]
MANLYIRTYLHLSICHKSPQSLDSGKLGSSLLPFCPIDVSKPTSNTTVFLPITGQTKECMDCRWKKKCCLHASLRVTHAPKRTKPGGACAQCKKLKKQCDGFPCSRCKNLGIDCQRQIVKTRANMLFVDSKKPYARVAKVGGTTAQDESLPAASPQTVQDKEVEIHADSDGNRNTNQGLLPHQPLAAYSLSRVAIESTTTATIGRQGQCARRQDCPYSRYGVPCTVCKKFGEKSAPATHARLQRLANIDRLDDAASILQPYCGSTSFLLAPGGCKDTAQIKIRSNIKLILELICSALPEVIVDLKDDHELCANTAIRGALWTAASEASSIRDKRLIGDLERRFTTCDDTEALKTICQLGMLFQRIFNYSHT